MSEKPDDRFGFWVRPSRYDDGTFEVNVVGPNPWHVAGFRSRKSGLDWVLGYLTTANDNGQRLALEEMERRRESDERVRAMQAAILERPPVKGKEN